LASALAVTNDFIIHGIVEDLAIFASKTYYIYHFQPKSCSQPDARVEFIGE